MTIGNFTIAKLTDDKIKQMAYHVCLSSPEAGGWWNTRGCELVSKHYGYTMCYCNHTTNFAVLLQVYETQVTFVCLTTAVDFCSILINRMCSCLNSICILCCSAPEEPRKRKSSAGADVHWLWSVSVWPPLHLHPLHSCGVSHKHHRVHSESIKGEKHFINPCQIHINKKKKAEYCVDV